MNKQLNQLKRKMSEFNLSEKIYDIDAHQNAYLEEDVKEFIKEDTKLIVLHWNDKSIEELLNKRRKIAGERLNEWI